MIRKILLSLLCIFCIAGTICAGFLFLYFAIPDKNAKAEINLPSQVEDSEQAAETTTEEDEDDTEILLPNVQNSLTLRSEPDSDSEELAGLVPGTQMEVIRYAEGTDFVYIRVLNGDYEGYEGYVNTGYTMPDA